MIDNRAVERRVLAGLGEWLQAHLDKPVALVRANQAGPVQPYPYGAYTVTTPLQPVGGTFSEAADGSFYKPILQVWSVTVVSDDHNEAQTVAMHMHDFLAQAGNAFLSDAGVVVQSAGNITNRDNLISIDYEKRQGFDFTLLLMNRIDTTRSEMSGGIDTAPLWRE